MILLSYLDLSYSNFPKNITFQLWNLSNLEYLDLSGNDFNEPENLEWPPQLSCLRYVDMTNVNLSKVNDRLQLVNKLHYLKSPYLNYCNLPTNFLVLVINSSTSLDVLSLSDNGLISSSSILEWLFNSNTSVVNLVLSYNNFHGLIPNGFSIINSLAHLYLDNNEFEGGIPKTFSVFVMLHLGFKGGC